MFGKRAKKDYKWCRKHKMGYKVKCVDCAAEEYRAKCPNCGHKFEGMAAHRTHWEEGYWSCHDDFPRKETLHGEPCRCIIYFDSEMEKQLGLDKKRKKFLSLSNKMEGEKP